MKIRLVSVGKILAVVVFLAVAVSLGVYLVKKRKPIDNSPVESKLQGTIVAIFNNTRYAHETDGRVRFVLTAGVDKAYSDGTHELEQVKLESYGAEGDRNDSITADRAKVSDTANLNTLDAEFIQNVVVQTTENGTLKTSYLHYSHEKNIIDTKEPVEFDSPTISGHATGMLIEIPDERVHLLNDVDLTVKPETAASKNAANQTNAKAQVNNDNETTEQRAARKAAKRARKQERRRQAAVSAQANPPATDKAAKKANKTGLNVASDGKPKSALPVAKLPTRIRAATALFDKKEHRVTLNHNVIVTQGSDEMRANDMLGVLTEANKFERIEARGNAYLKQTDKAEIKSTDMDFFFDDQRLTRAIANGEAYVQSLGSPSVKEARATTIEAVFSPTESGSAINTITANGNANLQIHPPKPQDEKLNPTERELSATQVVMNFYPDGQYLAFAQANENAVMKVTPVRAEKGADKKTIHAPQMTADFFPTNNQVKTFNATGGVKVEIEATVANAHPPRVTTSKLLTAEFIPESQDVDTLVQQGDFKYNEGDRNAVAEAATYKGQSEYLMLRGKRPMVWDAKARTQADEIDYDHRQDESHARGDVRTTYYSRATTNEATPFKNTKSPIFITAEKGDARNADGVAIYTGNARGWQDDNFVKADRIELFQNDKKMIATGKVESALYQVKTTTDQKQSEVVPGFATADRMTYSDTERLVHYDGNVKARQGTDNIEAAVVDVYLMKESNEVDHLTAVGNVALAQPGRRGTGDQLIYTSEDGRAVLSGKNARVEDAEKGTTMGAQLTFYSRNDKVVVENRQGTGRVKSTHRLTKK
ncbi:MAG: LPS export ABC transporter periplasmic protein LptC [Acidobacteria bacterium]|nr:LPS export ABC transporter periplasmic protein LptC [Acidobacteriota bacterium]